MSGSAAPQADLSEIPTSTLERLHQAISTDRLKMPVTRACLIDQGIRNQLEPLENALCGHTGLACLSILEAVLAERRANLRPPPELVWSGPERVKSTARDTAVVLRALFERTQRQAIVAGYDFTRGSSLLEPLWVAMRERHVDVRFFIHIEQTTDELTNPTAYADNAVRAVMDLAWPFGEPRPRVYYDSRALAPRPRFNMHAKCVVVDGECALVTSANFTQRAQEQNTECGAFLEDPTFAHHLTRQWLGLAEAGLMIESSR
jgi:hypothetical protein